MKTITTVSLVALCLVIGCSPSDSYKPAAERQYESADPPPADSVTAPSDSTASTDEEEGNTTEEVILRSL